jgi:signal transduction histidine kinase
VDTIFRKRPAVVYAACTLSLAFHAIALLYYVFKHDPGKSFTAVDAQVLILGSLLAAAVFTSFLTDSRVVFRSITIVRIGCLIALCFAYRSWFNIRLMLLAAVCLEIGFYERFPQNIFWQIGTIFSCFILLEVVWAVQGGWSRETALQTAQFILIPAAIGMPASFITRFREAFLAESGNSERLNQTVSQLSRSNVLLQDAAFRAEEQSRAMERLRVAREIHDTVGYSMTNLIMMMEAATDLVFDEPEELQRMMQAARDQAKSGLEETRRALRELREYEEPALKGLKAIDKLVSTYDHVNWVDVEVEYGNAPMTFGEEVDSVLFHFVQEGLTNALRHGKATKIRITFWQMETYLRVVVRDNGIGAQSISEGIGLSGMRERIRRLNGDVEAKNVDDGFQVLLIIPFGREKNGEDSRALSG